MEPKSKRPRKSASETKESLISAGLELLIEDGFSVGLDHITLERALRRAGVARSSAYYVWTSSDDEATPQEQFQREVLHRLLIDHLASRGFDETTGAAFEALTDADPGAPTVEVLREVVRTAGKANIEATATSEFWRLRIAAQNASAHLAGQPGFEDVRTWIEEAEEQWRQRLITEIYQPLSAALGLAPRAELGDRAWELLAIAAAALIDGLVYRLHFLDGRGLEEIDLPTPDGGTERWSIFALLLDAVVARLTEPTSTRFGDTPIASSMAAEVDAGAADDADDDGVVDSEADGDAALA